MEALSDAIYKRDTARVMALIIDGADVNKATASGDTPLILAVAFHGPTEIVNLLLEHGADVNKATASGNTPLLAAAFNGRTEIVKLLLAHGAEVNKANKHYGSTPLHAAAQYGHTEIARLLISHGAEVNKTTTAGNTPLYVAVSNDSTEIIMLLLSHEADVNKAGKYGYTPLHIAAGRGNTEISKILLSYDADINKRDDNGSTAILDAVVNNKPEVVKLLLLYGADINEIYYDDNTLLSRAASDGFTEIVKILLLHDADITLPRDDSVQQRAAARKYSPPINTLILRHAEAFAPIPSTLDDAIKFTEPLPTFFDVAMQYDASFSETRSEGGLMFKFGESYFSYPINQIKNEVNDTFGILYACNRELLHGAPHVADVDIENPYFLLRGPANYMIPLIQIKYILRNPGSWFYEIRDTGNIKKFIAGYGSVQASRGMNQSGRPVNIVSADHCQAGTTRRVYHLRELRLPAEGGGNMSGGDRHRRKTRRVKKLRQTRKTGKGRKLRDAVYNL